MRTVIREIRQERGLTQDQLAELSRVPRICISRYESGKYYPSLSNAMKLAKVLNVSVEDLIGKKAG
jgi:DNA-binding XRE family transcriptional regulator